jgi:Asp-tRNA(Asn)/Glu-tRNA(Gln) amidotransferase A subunit family amidase
VTLAEVPAALDLVRVGRALRSGGSTSVRLTEECLLAIATWNSALRAFITVSEERALDTAREADRELAAGYDRGPLHGIPISLKDIIDLAGTPTTAASDATSPDPVAADALVTRRLKASGAVIIGKTNLHEFALGTTSDQSAYGTVRNPLDQTRSAGGSSGGAAVSVVMRMAVAAIGTDTGGSIRIPAAACGIVGLKPAFGEVPTDGILPLSTSLDHVGPLAGSVADAAAVYQVLARTAARRLTPRAARGLRLGRLGGYMEAKLHPEVRAAYESAIERIARAGVAISPRQLAHADAVAPTYASISLAEGAACHSATLDRAPERYRAITRERLEQGRRILAETYLRALATQDEIRGDVDAALTDVDALVLPGMAIPAPVLGTDNITIDGIDELVRPMMLRLTQPFNLSGHPAIVLPCGRTTDGLPISLQLVGHKAATAALLDVAAGVEALLDGRA